MAEVRINRGMSNVAHLRGITSLLGVDSPEKITISSILPFVHSNCKNGRLFPFGCQVLTAYKNLKGNVPPKSIEMQYAVEIMDKFKSALETVANQAEKKRCECTHPGCPTLTRLSDFSNLVDKVEKII